MILITGCTGFVGSTLVRRLVHEGRQVRGLARNPERFKDPGVPRIPMERGDITDPLCLRRAMEGVDTVIHLVGILAESRGNTFDRVHAQGTRNVVNAARQAGVQRFLHMSALGTRADATSRYHQTKWQGEEAVRQSGLVYTIFRPSVIFGPRDEFVNQLARLLRHSPIAPILGDGRALLQPIWVEDVVRCFANALDNPATYGQTYVLGGPDQLSFQQVVEAIVTAMDKKRLFLHLPFPLLRLEAAFLELLPKPPLTRDQLLMAQEDNIGDTRPMRETFRFQPRSFQDGLRDYYLAK